MVVQLSHHSVNIKVEAIKDQEATETTKVTVETNIAPDGHAINPFKSLT